MAPRLSPADSRVSRTVLPGGLRVITESLPAVRSASIGIWAGVGSRDEDTRHAGATHYLPVPWPPARLLSPLLSVAPGQTVAWALAVAKGLDADSPAGLTKVTLAR